MTTVTKVIKIKQKLINQLKKNSGNQTARKPIQLRLTFAHKNKQEKIKNSCDMATKETPRN